MSKPKVNVADYGCQINENAPSLLNVTQANINFEFIKKPEVLIRTNASKSKHHEDIIKGLMVPSFSIGDRAVAYLKHEVLAVMLAQAQGKSKDEIRSLVKTLVAQRHCLTLGEQL
ncbi:MULTISPECIES: AlpA family transcriptional regulator [unclassified Colwellia]|jgi:prophage regulatory protein|uniref:helix-turn-helix transcriptional regulator n=1 Tax=unclassified Colwellia TaxID=196834 RepID=UPI0015F56B73|nr:MULTISPECIES: hypothetical protein [unclassified Colwellia]MBA6379289.1 hypothetical protein [Colwellia sp. BRX10-7]MBA6387085.1 hypothetical protein [Colwellia sp. BRX10-2]MBA6401821.1 hypothetical protein [Colwellia sp. BRX10-5]MBA6405731.1 hypothetical protein [Colwellia sp. BRX10-1]